MAQRSSRYKKGGPLREHGGIFSYQLDVQADIFTPKEARAEYARLRREANRRLEVLRRSEFAGWPAVRNRPSDFEALPKGLDEEHVRKALYDVARFLNLRTSSLKGARESMREWIESMQGKYDARKKKFPFDFVNSSNAKEFAQFLGDVQTKYGKKTYSSEQIAQIYKTAKDKWVDIETIKDSFDFWAVYKRKFAKTKRANQTISAEQMAKRMKMGKQFTAEQNESNLP